jgi:aminoglycoside phosphotransferase (APT) family kinase protein
VLVHGDYWLGNLLVDADRVVGVLDWGNAHWGERGEDLRHLVDSLVAAGLVSSREAPALAELASSACRQGEA